MWKSEIFFYITIVALAIIVLLLEWQAVKYVFLHGSVFNTVLALLTAIVFDSFALSIWFLD